MNKNFNIKDAVIFEFEGAAIDLRGDCELVSVKRYPGECSLVEMKWAIENSNQQIEVVFSSVEDFITKGRDDAYPQQSGIMLAISGFSDGNSCGDGDEFYVEPTQVMNYMSFVMDDRSAFLIKAGAAIIRRV